MLDELHVSNIALIEDATIAFSPSLTVLTARPARERPPCSPL